MGPLTPRPLQSMAMGIHHPGYHLLSLYAPLPPSDQPIDPESAATTVSYTYTQTNCTLPDQLGTYLHLYLPLAGCFFLFFFVPKLAAATRAWMQRRRHRRAASARTNGLPSTGGAAEFGLRGGKGVRSGGGGGGGHVRSLSQKLAALAGGGKGLMSARGATTAEEDADVSDAESQFPALLGGVSHLDGGSPYSSARVSDDEADGEDDSRRSGAAILPMARRGSPNGGGGGGRYGEKGSSGNGSSNGYGGRGHVRRVSRVWLWEGSSSRPTSPRDSLSGSGLFGSASAGGGGSSRGTSFLFRLLALAQRSLERFVGDSFLAPLHRRFVRPVWRSFRSTWRKLAAPLAAAAQGHVGGPVGQALAEAVRDMTEVCWPAVALWCAHVVWYLS